MRGWCWRFAMAAVAGHERGGNQHTAFLRCLAHRLTSVQAVHGMWRTEGPSPALYYLAQLEEPSVSVDVLRTVHAASMAVVPVDASEGFPLCLPAYPFAEDKEGHCEAAGDGVPGVAWVEHHAACLLALLASPYAECVRDRATPEHRSLPRAHPPALHSPSPARFPVTRWWASTGLQCWPGEWHPCFVPTAQHPNRSTGRAPSRRWKRRRRLSWCTCECSKRG